MRKKVARALEASFGQTPDVDYFQEDLDGIRMYYEYRRRQALDAFYLDDITWNDLGMDAVFKRINATQTTSGEQHLYYQLRTPTVEGATYQKRSALLRLMEEDAALRLRIQFILSRVGKRRAANTVEAFTPQQRSPFFLLLTVLLVVALIACIAGVFFSKAFGLPLIICLFANVGYHTYMMHVMDRDIATMQYTVSVVAACRKMRGIKHPELEAGLADFFAAGERARRIAREGNVVQTVTSDLVTYINLFFLTDLIAYERLKRSLKRYEKEIRLIHETLGAIDAAIATASYRKSVALFCDPQLDFDPSLAPRLYVEEMAHPLVASPVLNTVEIAQPLLITGSNASGKSTFIKAAVINAILAQSICTALCRHYQATSFYLYTSMAIADDVLAGDSYFIAEIKSVRRIVEAAQRQERILCAIDEVLRGTNTIERIAASSELLATLAGGHVLCLAATHDGELCAMLPEYRQMHFEEEIRDGVVVFDYKLKEGRATTRNAIKLLGLLGFERGLVDRAEQKATHYLQTGQWGG